MDRTLPRPQASERRDGERRGAVPSTCEHGALAAIDQGHRAWPAWASGTRHAPTAFEEAIMRRVVVIDATSLSTVQGGNAGLGKAFQAGRALLSGRGTAERLERALIRYIEGDEKRRIAAMEGPNSFREILMHSPYKA